MISGTHVFHEYLRENEKVCETCLYGALAEFWVQKDGRKSHDTVSLRLQSLLTDVPQFWTILTRGHGSYAVYPFICFLKIYLNHQL